MRSQRLAAISMSVLSLFVSACTGSGSRAEPSQIVPSAGTPSPSTQANRENAETSPSSVMEQRTGHAAGHSAAPGMGPVAGDHLAGSQPPAPVVDVDMDAGAPMRDAGARPDDPASSAPNDIPPADAFPKLQASMFGTPKLISSQFDLAEGPVWDHCQSLLLFSDVNNRRIHTFVPGGEIGVYVERSNYVNGMIFDPEGRLLLAEMGGNSGGRITRMKRDKTIEVLVERDANGARFNTSDDLTLAADGTIYFSDPDITHGPHIGNSLIRAPFYRLQPGEPGARSVSLVGRGAGTNGIRLTRDQKTLLVVEYSGGNVAKYNVAADGSLTAAGNLVSGLSKPDSFCLDVAGNVYLGVDLGIQVLRPDGSKVTVLPVGSNTTNCAFGGPDGKTLFITAWSKLLQLDGMPVPGLDWYGNKHMKCD